MTMRVAGFEAFGGPEQVQLLSAPVPSPGPTEVLVRVAASPVNPGDAWLLSGTLPVADASAPFPKWGGMELAGTVVAVGDEVARLEPGDSVVAQTTFLPEGRGAHAEYVLVDHRSCVRAPRGVSPLVAATLPMNGLTALQCADLASGRVLVIGAGGALGRLVVQLVDSEVTACARQADHASLLALGATSVATLEELSGRSFDCVIDTACLGHQVVSLVRPGGRLLAVRPAGYEPLGDVELTLISVRRELLATERLAGLVALVESGALVPPSASPFAPASAADAYRLLELPGRSGQRPVIDWALL